MPTPPSTPEAARAEVDSLVAALAVATAARDATLRLPERQRSASQVRRALEKTDQLEAEIVVAKRRLRTLQRAATRARRKAQ